jgi:catechol 2,3-dioxygenase-like lactoylglutathione lyase family enzyme
MVHNLSHVAVGVRDMDRSLRFYRDVIGLDVRFDGIEEFGGEPPVRRRGVYLRWADDPHAPFLVLDEQLTEGRARDASPKQLYDVGVHHFGFWVDDVDGIAARAADADAAVVYGPSDVDTAMYAEPPGGTIRLLILRDPDGNVVQLDQRIGG